MAEQQRIQLGVEKVNKAKWTKAISVLRSPAKITDKALHQALLREAEHLRGRMVAQIVGGGFKGHSLFTTMLRQLGGFAGSKVLIRSGGLVGSFSTVDKWGSGKRIFVGIARGAMRHGGGRYDVAKVHEFGKSWSMSERQRRWFYYQLIRMGIAPSGTGTGKVTIPKRPYVKPVFQKYASSGRLKRNVAKHIAQIMAKELPK